MVGTLGSTGRVFASVCSMAAGSILPLPPWQGLHLLCVRKCVMMAVMSLPNLCRMSQQNSRLLAQVLSEYLSCSVL